MPMARGAAVDVAETICGEGTISRAKGFAGGDDLWYARGGGRDEGRDLI